MVRITTTDKLVFRKIKKTPISISVFLQKKVKKKKYTVFLYTILLSFEMEKNVYIYRISLINNSVEEFRYPPPIAVDIS